MPIPSFFGNTMKTRSFKEYNTHAVDKHAVVDIDTVEEERQNLESTGESGLQKSSISKTLRRVDQNAKAAFRRFLLSFVLPVSVQYCFRTPSMGTGMGS